MRNRLLWSAVLLVGLVFQLTGCANNNGLDAISVTPSTQALNVGQSAQLSVTGTYGNASHPTTKPVTVGLSWTSSSPSVAAVSTDGLVTALSAGSTTVTASAAGFAGTVTSTCVVTVSGAGGSTGGGSVIAIEILPGSQSVSGPGQTAQYLAIGTTSNNATVNLTTQVTWTSSVLSVATVGANTGLATGVGQGSTTITALYIDPTSGATITGTASFNVSGTAGQEFTALTIIPGSQGLSASGQTGQLVALGTSGSTGFQLDVTDSPQIQWLSSSPSVATVSATGLVTGVSAGASTITAELSNSDGSLVTATSTVNVTLTAAPEPILSLEIIPSSITVNDFNLSGQFIAIGTYATAPYVRDVTNDPATIWLSSEPNFFPVSNNTGGGPGASAGIVTSEGAGSATIIAESSSPDGTIQTATASFNCPQVLAAPGSNIPPSCPDTIGTGSPLLSTLTVYQRGLNTTNWEVTAPSATGTANVLHCGPGWTGAGGSVCTATYPVGTTVTLTSPAGAGAFGGWSSNCTPVGTPTANGPNSCTVTLTDDDVVGVIVN